MRFAIAFASFALVGPAIAAAQTIVVTPTTQGIVYRLPEADKTALLDRLSEREPAKADEFSSGRPTQAARIGLGLLGFLGSAAADASTTRRCGFSTRNCDGILPNAVDGNDVLRR